MGALLGFFTAGTARIQALLVAALATAALCLALACWALWERAGATQARAERDKALDQLAAVVAAARACSASVDQAKRVGDAAIAATGELVAAAKRINQPAEKTVERIETILERPAPADAGCDQAWDAIEQDRKAGAPGSVK